MGIMLIAALSLIIGAALGFMGFSWLAFVIMFFGFLWLAENSS